MTFIVGETYQRTYGGEATCIFRCNENKYAFHMITANGKDDIYFVDADGYMQEKHKQIMPTDLTESFFK